MPPPSTPPPLSPPREGFALCGPSIALDPRTHAVRSDLADVRLAEYVFAPHYAAPMTCRLVSSGALRAGRDPASEILTELSSGDAFEVLEFAGPLAWGTAPGKALVGYLPAEVLA